MDRMELEKIDQMETELAQGSLDTGLKPLQRAIPMPRRSGPGRGSTALVQKTDHEDRDAGLGDDLFADIKPDHSAISKKLRPSSTARRSTRSSLVAVARLAPDARSR